MFRGYKNASLLFTKFIYKPHISLSDLRCILFVFKKLNFPQEKNSLDVNSSNFFVFGYIFLKFQLESDLVLKCSFPGSFYHLVTFSSTPDPPLDVYDFIGANIVNDPNLPLNKKFLS